MSNISGNVYALTVLSPIRATEHREDSPVLALRKHLAYLPTDERGPFAKLISTHMARLSVIDDVAYLGTPVREEHLKSRYLMFESNFDGDLDTYLEQMAIVIPGETDAIWKHCFRYPGTKDVAPFIAYMKQCQIKTDFFYADVSDRTVEQTLRALALQKAVARFIEEHQGVPPAEVQQAFAEFKARVSAEPSPIPGSRSLHEFARSTKVGD